VPDNEGRAMSAREVPRPFKFHWGSGEIVELLRKLAE
jgi:hypothetical protein